MYPDAVAAAITRLFLIVNEKNCWRKILLPEPAVNRSVLKGSLHLHIHVDNENEVELWLGFLALRQHRTTPQLTYCATPQNDTHKKLYIRDDKNAATD